MTLTFRVILIAASVLTMIFTIRKIRKSQMEIADSLFWIILSPGLVILSIFPHITTYFTRLLGFQSEVNLVYISIIFVVILKLFTLSIEVSQLKSKLRQIIQEHAISESDRRKKDDDSGG